MNSKKKQTIAVAMATALGVSAMMSPVAVHAQEEDPATAITQEDNQQDSSRETKLQDETPVAEQGAPANEIPQTLSTNSLPSATGTPIHPRSNGAFTDFDEAKQAVQTALEGYPVSNETSEQEIQDFLNEEFVDTGKLKKIDVSLSSKTEATPTATGSLLILIRMEPVGESVFFSNTSHPLTIPRLLQVGEVAIDKTNFPDDTFRKYVSDNFDDDNDDVLSVDEISKVTSIIIINNSNLKSLKGIEYFADLTTLLCHHTGIEELDVSNNRALTRLDCPNTGIGSLDVSNNRALTRLDCYNTGISSLDVTNNTALQELSCSNTQIQTLDVSNNTALTNLHCSNTGISSLDVSKNTALMYLNCFDTGISSLDVSRNTALRELSCYNTPLAWLNLGNQPLLNDLNMSSSVVDLAVTSDSFDMTQAFAGIDISKVHITDGATLNGDSITGYTLGKPITYTYDCGTVQGNPVTLDVTLNLHKSDSDIQITGNLDMTYTGKPIVNPSVNSTGSKGTVTFTYEKWNSTTWEVLSDMPTDAGRYNVQAHLAGDDFNNDAVSEKKEFTITQATNSWNNAPTIANWTYGGQPDTPTATAQFGNPTFTYSDSKTGTFTSDVPVNAGTWYIKATVAGTDNYTALESILAFTISPKNIKDGNITVSDINNDNDVKKLIVKDDDRELVKGTDYDVETKKDGNKTIVTIAFKGNYAGTIERIYTVETSQPEKPEQKPQQDKPQEPSQAESQEKPKDTGHVNTGDTTQTGLLATLGVLSVGCIAFLTGKRRKGKKD